MVLVCCSRCARSCQAFADAARAKALLRHSGAPLCEPGHNSGGVVEACDHRPLGVQAAGDGLEAGAAEDERRSLGAKVPSIDTSIIYII